jgi:phosphatidylglycerophosphatase C
MLVRFALGLADRGQLKAAWIGALMGGCTRGEVESWTARFIPRLIARGLHADARAAIEMHRTTGDRLVLLSASPDLYVPAIGSALGFAQVLCTRVAWRDDRLTGALATPNQRGAEKARSVVALRAQYPQLPLVAYGNAASDLEHLRLADCAVLVNGSREAREAAARSGINCVTWR